MIKKTLLALALGLPLLALAATDAKPAPTAKPAPAKKAAVTTATPALAASRPLATDHNVRKAEIAQQHARGATMGACLKKAADQGLSGVERKQFLGSCANAAR
ncbi:exported hypothetical protein [Rubrivivax sp. A210]|uniref:PsiF family protein n=1 Tax=Rubrivivax sp. A210 TaxID=2772301 RepID=UPI001917EB0F|nr:PsiF family protein [Rubrivivax sp. A210]CAD5373334.1 exported hypothetical protein [Rubrivivax sp. A210]